MKPNDFYFILIQVEGSPYSSGQKSLLVFRYVFSVFAVICQMSILFNFAFKLVV